MTTETRAFHDAHARSSVPGASRRDIHGIHFIRARGTFADRTRAHAALLKDEIPRGAVPALVAKNEALIRGGPGIVQVKLVQDLVVWAYKRLLVPWLARRLEPEYRDGLRIFCDETGLPVDTLREAFFHVDGLLLLARISIMKHLRRELSPTTIGACSSAVALGEWTSSGRMLVGRNLDYPVVGPWEKDTTVLFHEPTESGEIPHVAITSAGVHTGGLTSVNREGLTVASHVIFGRELSLGGSPFVTIGDRIVRHAKNLDEAVDVARKNLPKNPWSYVIASARDKEAIVLEVSPTKVSVVPTQDGFLSHANLSQSPELQADEALIGGAAYEDFERRRCGLREALAPFRGTLEPRHMTAALGDHLDRETGEERVFGNVVSGITTAQSVVLDPEAQKLWVSSRAESPCGLGEFIEVDVERFWTDRTPPTIPGSTPTTPGLLEGIRHYRDAFRALHVEHGPAAHEEAIAAIRSAIADYPSDGHLWVQLGLVLFQRTRFEESDASFRGATQRRLSTHVREVCELFLARLADVRGSRAVAVEIYSKHAGVREPRLRRAYLDGMKRRYSVKRAPGILLDLQFADALEY